LPGRFWPFPSRRDRSQDAEAPSQSTPPRGEPAVERRQIPRQDSMLLEVELHESRSAQAGLRHELADLLKAHREQSRVLDRTHKAAQAGEAELTQARKRIASLEAEIASHRARAMQLGARVQELEGRADRQAGLESERTALLGQRDELQARLNEVARSRDNAAAERERLSEQVAALHATIAGRDAEIASLRIAEDDSKGRLDGLVEEVAELRAVKARLEEEAARLAPLEAARTRLQLEYDSLAARWEVARAQLEEAEQSLRGSQATIKAAQRLSASVEWRSALDGVLDAASELVRFERGTLALVDEVQDELKIEAARNSPIAVGEMSRFKIGEGIAGWALSHREAVLVRDSRSDTRFKASDPAYLPRSFIAVPLLSGSEGLGVLTLARSANDPFDEHDLRSLARVASDAARALTNARLVHLLKQREDHLTTLVQKAKELWTAGDLEQVLEFVMASALELAGGTAALLALRDPRTQELEVAASRGIPEAVLAQRIAWGAPAAMDVLRTRKPWVSRTRDMLPAALAGVVEEAGLVSVISVACVTQPVPVASADELLSRSDLETVDEVAGVLQVYRRTADQLPSAQVEQLRGFAEQAAVAIRNVRRGDKVKGQLQTTVSINAKLLGRERFINQLQFRIQQLEKELRKFKAA